MNDIENVTCYLAMINFDLCMGSYAHASTAFDAISSAKKIAEVDFDSMFIFGDEPCWINVYDYSKADGWYKNAGADPRDTKTKQPLPYLYSVSVKLKNSAKTLKAYRAKQAKKATA